jgi:hypothetical protein
VWTLDLPGGLEGGTTDALFTSGTQKLRERDNRGALQDFYRVLTTDPGSADADKFAVAAGERVVVARLQGLLDERSTARLERHARKAKLLKSAARTGRVGRQAEASLREEFREDPEVISAMSWQPTESMEARTNLTKDAAAALAGEEWAEAAKLFNQILADESDADLRMTAVGGLKTSRRELSRRSSDAWREAVVATALGDASAAAAWQRVRELDPDNPCATLQPR